VATVELNQMNEVLEDRHVAMSADFMSVSSAVACAAGSPLRLFGLLRQICEEAYPTLLALPPPEQC
jgi:hypothetical protein